MAAVIAAGVVGFLIVWGLAMSDGTKEVDEGIPGRAGSSTIDEPDITGDDSLVSGETNREFDRQGLSGTEVVDPLQDGAVERIRPGQILVRGRVTTCQGIPLAGVNVFEVLPQGLVPKPNEIELHSGESTRVTSDAEGLFVLSHNPGRVVVGSTEIYRTVFAGIPLGVSDESSLQVIVAPRISISGIVVNSSEKPIVGARVEVWVSDSLLQELGVRNDRVEFARQSCLTDSMGTFSLGEVPSFCNAVLRVAATDYESTEFPVPQSSEEAMRIVLSGSNQIHRAISGTVVDLDHVPVVDAYVSAGAISTRTNEMGVFRLDLDHPAYSYVRTLATIRVTAVAKGYSPSSIECSPPNGIEEGRDHAPVVIVLERQLRTIRGIVVDNMDVPLERVMVRLLDPTAFGVTEVTPGSGRFVRRTVEEIAAGRSVSWTRTDNSGRFVLSGLLDRSYRLEVLQKETLCSNQTSPIFPDDRDVVIRLDTEVSKVSGSVVGLDGIGRERVKVSIARALRESTQGDSPVGFEIGASDWTDRTGHFDLGPVAKAATTLRIEGEGIIPHLSWQMEPNIVRDDLLVAVEGRRDFRISVESPELDGGNLRCCDGSNQTVSVWILHGGVFQELESINVGIGVSEVLSVTERVRTVCVFQGGKEVRRLSVHLTDETVSVINLQ